MEIVYLTWIAFGIFIIGFIGTVCWWWYHRAVSITDRRLIRPDGKAGERDSALKWILRAGICYWCILATVQFFNQPDPLVVVVVLLLVAVATWSLQKRFLKNAWSYVCFCISQLMVTVGTHGNFMHDGKWLISLAFGAICAAIAENLINKGKKAEYSGNATGGDTIVIKPKPRVFYRLKSGVLPVGVSLRTVETSRVLSKFESGIKSIEDPEWWLCRWSSDPVEGTRASVVLVRECSKNVRAMVWFEVKRLGDMLEWTMYGSELRRSNAPAFNQSHFAYSADQNRKERLEEPMVAVGQIVWDMAAGNLTNQDDGMKVQGLVTVAETNWLNSLKDAMEGADEASSRGVSGGLRTVTDPTERVRETVE